MTADRNLTAAASAMRLWVAAISDEYDESVAQVAMRAIAELLEAAVDTTKDPGFRVLYAKNLALTIEKALWEACSGSPHPTTDDLRNVAEHVLSLIEQVQNDVGSPEVKAVPQGSEAVHA